MDVSSAAITSDRRSAATSPHVCRRAAGELSFYDFGKIYGFSTRCGLRDTDTLYFNMSTSFMPELDTANSVGNWLIVCISGY